MGENILYHIVAKEQHDSYGYKYNVINIRRDKPNSEYDMQLFLSEIMTAREVSSLYSVYPDIVDRVIENRLEDIDLNKLHGIKEKTFEKIKKKIIDNFCLIEIIDQFQGLLDIKMVKKLYDKYPSTGTIIKRMKQDPYKCLCGIAGIGFKTADTLLLEVEERAKELKSQDKEVKLSFDIDLKTSMQRCLACIIYLLEENESEGHTQMDLVNLKNQCDKMVPACSQYFVEAVQTDSIYYEKEKRIVALRSTYKTEKYLAHKFLQAIQNPVKWNYNWQSYQNTTEYPLTDEQMEAVKNLCEYSISILNGAAGTGKSATTGAMIQMLEDNRIGYALMSPTGKAAKVLAEYTKRPASTIHRGLAYNPSEGWGYNETHPLDCEVVLVDEFSMVDIFLCKHLLEAINFTRTKLVLIGDNAQLPSVQCGNILHDLLECDIVPTTTLTKVFRYADGGLMQVATDTRLCKPFLNKEDLPPVVYIGESDDYAFIGSHKSTIINNVLAIYEKLIKDDINPSDIQVLSAYNIGDYGTIALNEKLQKIANVDYEKKACIKIGQITYYCDDIILQTKNNYHAKLYGDFFIVEDVGGEAFIANGETGKIIDIENSRVVIDFDGVQVIYNRDEMTNVNLGYSISIHKSQGSGIANVIMITPAAHTFFLNSNLIYVGMTRTKNRCYHFGDISTVNQAVKKKANLERNTFLQNLLTA